MEYLHKTQRKFNTNKLTHNDLINSVASMIEVQDKDYYTEALNTGEAEFIATKNAAGGTGLSVFGSIKGIDLGQIYTKFLQTLKPEQKNTENLIALFENWIKKTEPELYNEIQKVGGIKKFLGNDGKPDIQRSGATSADPTKPGLGKEAYTVTPD